VIAFGVEALLNPRTILMLRKNGPTASSSYRRFPVMRLSARLLLIPALTALAACADASKPVPANPLLRMPGTQPGQVTIDGSSPCYACHGSGNAPWVRPTPDQRNRTNYEEYNLFRAWQGSMMGNSARDPLMFACLTVAAQDSMHVIGNADVVDLCMRCHFPKGWLEGRAAVRNVSAMTGEDYDGIQCTFCHRLSDPFPRPRPKGPARAGASWSNTTSTTARQFPCRPARPSRPRGPSRPTRT
jgi:hypothetical protein